MRKMRNIMHNCAALSTHVQATRSLVQCLSHSPDPPASCSPLFRSYDLTMWIQRHSLDTPADCSADPHRGITRLSAPFPFIFSYMFHFIPLLLLHFVSPFVFLPLFPLFFIS